MKAKSILGIIAVLAIAGIVWILFFQDSHEPAHTDPSPAPTIEKPEPTRGEEPAVTPAIAERREPTRESISGEDKSKGVTAAPGEGVVIGRIVESEGATVPNFKVEAYGADTRNGRPDMSNWFEEKMFVPNFRASGTKTNDEGRFVLKGLNPKGLYVLGLDFGGSRPQIRILDHVPNPGQVVDLGDIVLEPYVTFIGRVLDAGGAPVPSARVRASILPAIAFSAGIAEVEPKGAILVMENSQKQVFTAPSWMQQLLEKFPVPTTLTDNDGYFKLQGVQIGLATVVVDSKEKPVLIYGPTATGKSGEKNLGDLKMEDGETVEGKVVDSSKKPIAGAEVYVGPKSSIAPVAILHPVGKTDANGKFIAKGFKSTSSYAVARVDSASPWGISEEFSPGGDDPVIQVHLGFDLTVLLKSANGDPILNGDVLLKSALAAQEFPVLFPPVSLQGRTEKLKDGAIKITRLNPGEYMLVARAPGHAITMQEASLATSSTQVEVTLPVASGIKVQVTDKETGKPIPNAFIQARPGSQQFWTVSLCSATTNGSGEGTLSGLAPGPYFIEAAHAQYATVSTHTTVPMDNLSIAMDTGGILEGRVHQGGRNIDSPRLIAIEPRNERSFIALPRMASTDLEGRFRVTNLEAGEYRVHVQGRLINQGMLDLMKMMQGGPDQKNVKTSITAGKTTMLEIDLANNTIDGPSGKLVGHVTMNGRPGSNINVSTWNEGRRSATTDASGYFDLGSVTAGDNWVTLSLPAPEGQLEPYRLGSRNVSVKENETVEVNWNFNTGVIRGKVIRKRTGRPAAFAQVSASIQYGDEKKPESSWVRTRTNDQGEYVFDPAPAGKWSISVRQSGSAPPTITTELAEGQERIGVDIELEEAVKYSGTINLPAGTPRFGWIWLSFYQGNRRQGTGASVDADKLTFNCDSIGPGKYTAQLYTWTDGERSSIQWETVEVEVPEGGAEGITLVFSSKPQPK